MTFAQRLVEAMEIRGMKQAELAEKAGLSRASISQYASGKHLPGVEAKIRLAEVLDVSQAYLDGKTDAVCGKRHERNVPVSEAARMLGKSQQFVRVALQRGAVPFGFAVRVSAGRWNYHISPGKLEEYMQGSK